MEGDWAVQVAMLSRGARGDFTWLSVGGFSCVCTVTMNNQEEEGNLVLMKMHEPALTILGLHVASGASINTHGIVLGSLIRDVTSTDEFMYQEDCSQPTSMQ